MKEKFYPFSPKLTKALKKHRLLTKAKRAYDSVPDYKKSVIEENNLSSCFIFSMTKEGNHWWMEVCRKIES